MTIVVVLSSANTEAAPDSAPRRIVTRFETISVDVVYIGRDGTTAIPYFWMGGVRCDAFESALEADPNIAIIDRIERTDEGAFYKAAWNVDSPLIQCVSDANGIILEAKGTAECWRLNVWFEDRTSASAFQQCSLNRDVPLTVHRLASVTEYFDTSDVNLSPRQRETLVLAHQHGYFDEPRGITQEQLATKLDISSSAVGSRLRRGLDTLVGESVVE